MSSTQLAGTEKRLRGWQIATAVLAVTTVVGLIWGFMATKNANDQNAANQAQIEQLQAQMASEEGSAAKHLQADAEKIRQFETELKAMKGNLKVDTKEIKTEAEKIKQLNQKYQQEKTAAAAEDASLQSKLNAAESRAQLAEHCSAVMASGLAKIYEDVPSIVTYKEVAAVMNTAAANCQGIVNVPTP